MAVDMDKLLRQAFDQIAKEEYENRPVEIPEHKFSLRFHWKMHKLFRMSGAGKKEGVGKTGGSPMELFRPIRSKRKIGGNRIVDFNVGGRNNNCRRAIYPVAAEFLY